MRHLLAMLFLAPLLWLARTHAPSLLMPDCADAACKTTSTTTTTTTTTAAATTTTTLALAPTQVAETVAVFFLEEDTTTTRVNAEGTTARDLNANTSVPRSATKWQGSYSADFSDANDLNRAESTLRPAAPMSLCFATYIDTTPSGSPYVPIGYYTGSAGGLVVQYTSGAEFNVTARDAAGAGTTARLYTVSTGAWNHWCATINSANTTVSLYRNAGTPATATGTAIYSSTGTFSVNLGDAYGDNFDGKVDEVVVDNQEYSAAEVCYLCSCGIANSESCTCNGTAFDAKGRNTSCGACTLPADCTDPIQ